MWLILLTVYFAVVVVVSAYLLWRSRSQTSIYNVDLETIERTLARILVRLGLEPMRSGDMYYFSTTNSGRIDAPPVQALGSQSVQTEAAKQTKAQTSQLLDRRNVILEVDAFRPLWHVTLRWDPPDSGIRQEIERELERELADTPAPSHLLGFWLTCCSFGLFLLMCLIGLGMIIYHIITLRHRF